MTEGESSDTTHQAARSAGFTRFDPDAGVAANVTALFVVVFGKRMMRS